MTCKTICFDYFIYIYKLHAKTACTSKIEFLSALYSSLPKNNMAFVVAISEASKTSSRSVVGVF